MTGTGGGYRDGDRVRSPKLHIDGTVRFVDDVAKVQWDGLWADRLDLVRAHLIPTSSKWIDRGLAQ